MKIKSGYFVTFDVVGYYGKGKNKKKLVNSMDSGMLNTLGDVKASVEFYTNHLIRDGDVRTVKNVKVFEIKKMKKSSWNKA
jgi:hypothetical protein